MKKTALITGGSKGIGRALARQFAADRYDLVLTARTQRELTEAADELSKYYGVSVTTITSDLSDPSAPQALFDQIKNSGVEISALINNAGFGDYGAFRVTDLEKELSMIQVNISSLIHLTKLFLPQMQEHNDGGVINIASTAAFQPGPLMAVYYATKAFVLSFSEALHEELSDFNVTVTTICPGPTRSNFQSRSKISNTRLIRLGIMRMMEADEVAAIGYEAFTKGKGVVIPGKMNWLGAYVARIVPFWISSKTIKILNQRRR